MDSTSIVTTGHSLPESWRMAQALGKMGIKVANSLFRSSVERVIAVRLLICQVELIMEEAGDTSMSFDFGAWFSAWVEEPQPILGNQSAAELTDTVERRQLVSRQLAQSCAN